MSITLDELPRNERARVLAIRTADLMLEANLRETGFAEGDDVEVVQLGPIAGKPICVRLNQTLIALRANEAAAIIVESVS